MSKNKNNTTPASEPVTEEITLIEEPSAAPLAVANLDDEFADDVYTVSADDVVIARYKLVQGLTKGKREYGLQDGNIYNTTNFKQFKSANIVVVSESRVVIERTAEAKSVDGKSVEKGAFVAEHALNSDVVKAALARNQQKFDKNLKTLDGNVLQETRNLHIAFLDDAGEAVTGFGVLMATSTNLFPVRQWITDRGAFQRDNGKPGSSLPVYAFRAVVDGQGVHKKNETALYRFNPLKNGSWKDSAIDPQTCSEKELNLLRSLKAHAELIKSGKAKIAEVTTTDVTEEEAEIAAF